LFNGGVTPACKRSRIYHQIINKNVRDLIVVAGIIFTEAALIILVFFISLGYARSSLTQPMLAEISSK